MRFIFDCIYLLAALAVSPIAIYRMARHNRYRTGWNQKLGKITRKHPGKKCIWLHAVSVGEVNATRTLIDQLQKKFPDYETLISTTTDTGFARATALYADRIQVVYFPFDFSFIIHRVFRDVRPSICLLMELEVWPNFVQIAHKLNVPVVVVNGRISERSFAKYKLIKPVAKQIFQKLSFILAQTDEYAQRFIDIGTPTEKVTVTGSLKYDTAQVTGEVHGADELAAQLNITDEKLWVAGATGNDEEKIILDIYRDLKQQDRFKNLRLAIIPRKPERFDEVAQLTQLYGFDLIRYSRIKTNNAPAPNNKNAVILGDTMGDLRKFYSLATIIFVGRSLVPMGGSDMVEAAALGKCTIFGPHAFNFKQTVNALLAENGAIMVKDKEDLLLTMEKCLTEPDFAAEIAQAGQNVIRKNQGATEKTIQQIAKLLTPTPKPDSI